MSARDGHRWALVRTCVPALADAERGLRLGATVASIGSDGLAVAMPLALAYPASTFHGFAEDADAVAAEREAAAIAGLSHRVTFERAVERGAGPTVAGGPYDLILSGPDAERSRAALSPGGVWLRVGGTHASVARRSALVRRW